MDRAAENISPALLRDLTDRKLADARLRASEEQFRLFTENVRRLCVWYR
ncbi:MAG: hypothetical protein JWP08_2418 [Bryobacterales bacterium]|nr:hypothetical protein [Bryobacterales bacterium]